MQSQNFADELHCKFKHSRHYLEIYGFVALQVKHPHCNFEFKYLRNNFDELKISVGPYFE